MRVQIHVRANASAPAVGGEFNDGLIVRVVEPAESGRATEAALRALATSIDVPRRCVTLVSGARSQRKLVEINVASADASRVAAALGALRAGKPD